MTMMPDPDSGLPRLVKLYIRQVGFGFALSAVFVALLLGFDMAHLRSLMLTTQGGYIAAFLLFFFNGLVFAGVQFAIAIMRMSDHDDQGPRGGHRQSVSQRLRPGDPIPVRISIHR